MPNIGTSGTIRLAAALWARAVTVPAARAGRPQSAAEMYAALDAIAG